MEPRLRATKLTRPPLDHCHFILARTKAQSAIFLFKEPLYYGHPVDTARLWPVGDWISGVRRYFLDGLSNIGCHSPTRGTVNYLQRWFFAIQSIKAYPFTPGRNPWTDRLTNLQARSKWITGVPRGRLSEGWEGYSAETSRRVFK